MVHWWLVCTHEYAPPDPVECAFQYFDKLWSMLRYLKVTHFVEKNPLIDRTYTI